MTIARVTLAILLAVAILSSCTPSTFGTISYTDTPDGLARCYHASGTGGISCVRL